MAFENFPAAEQPQRVAPTPPKKDWRNYLLVFLTIALLGTWGYIIWKTNKSNETIQQKDTVIATTSSQKDELQKELDEATMRYDQIKTSSSNMMHSKDSVIGSKERDINAKKEKIRQLLAKGESDKEAMAQARTLISSLNNDIDGYKTKIETLEGQNIVLTHENEAVTHQRDEVRKNLDSAQLVLKQKEDIIDIGSTLHASNFSILGINEKGNGEEKETTTAKRVDKLRISFDLDENRITQTGTKNIFVCITGPDGNPISAAAFGSGKFNARDGQEKSFTQKLDVNYTQGQRQTVSFDFKGTGFQTGDYKIEVYNNGFKIGEGVRSLKKGGLFS
jgi:hypothetical protein